jgi:hypothetical protein
MGRPPLGEKPAGIFPVRLPDEIVMAIDAFAKREAIKGRSEAIRRLVELGLEASADKPGMSKPAPTAKPRRPGKQG